MTLTARMVEQAKPREKPYKLSDRDGLYLYVSPTGAKSWRKNYKAHGKQATATFGRWPEMTLADARKACADLGKESTNRWAGPGFPVPHTRERRGVCRAVQPDWIEVGAHKGCI